jgi:rare lipoprotein A (peptidoglycan hydrolase)
MARSRNRTRLVPALMAAFLAVPAAALADGPTGGAAAPPPAPRGTVVLTGSAQALLGQVARYSGTARRRDHGRTVRIQRFDDAAKAWRSEARATVARDGSFSASWRPQQLGPARLRAVVSRAGAASAGAPAPSSELAVKVFKPGMATWFGPGFYGKQTACGQTLTKDLVGVAHRTLPCGTQVEISYRGHSMVVPVVDRGPYTKGMKWDLTAAAAQALGFTQTDRVGALLAQPAAASAQP